MTSRSTAGACSLAYLSWALLFNGSYYLWLFNCVPWLSLPLCNLHTLLQHRRRRREVFLWSVLKAMWLDFLSYPSYFAPEAPPSWGLCNHGCFSCCNPFSAGCRGVQYFNGMCYRAKQLVEFSYINVIALISQTCNLIEGVGVV